MVLTGRSPLRAGLRAIGRLIAPPPSPRIVFLGDSITFFWQEADPSLFRPHRINRGVSGETTVQMLERFERDVVAAGPRAVHVMGGTNDLWHGAPGPMARTAIANLVEMARIAASHGIAVVLADPPPIAPAAAGLFGHAELFPVLRAAIGAHCRAAGLVHVDYARSLADEAGALLPAFTTDGVHLTRQGYRAMRGQAEHALAAALAGGTAA